MKKVDAPALPLYFSTDVPSGFHCVLRIEYYSGKKFLDRQGYETKIMARLNTLVFVNLLKYDTTIFSMSVLVEGRVYHTA